ncbi:cytochrome c class I [Acidithiobacillus ferrivorans SS3]|uniref:Cytochrome c class I n=1 Tax=Acidithiobacillus ferrivorans SS3 TaxID=743299 RepID=G0JKZ8_9PROT|nr:c-type cytochrome [Acidithiobacillus ferrivorans]AEM47995.1 cytochrome c class I [Acidithiobacillus ferrivorans SS3]MBU2851693.1 c-type cytochrome [Acidithiobacillus ferrivorans]OFA15130.1 cytochrome C552 [Acidithiobacillus ferrivorans]
MTTHVNNPRFSNKEHNGMSKQKRTVNKSAALLISGALLAVAGQASAAGGTGAPAPYRISSDCMICHGMTGNNTIYPIVPKLAGQHKGYLETQLKAFKDRSRADQNGEIYMWPVAQSLDAANIKELASYFASQKPPMQSSGVKHAGIKEGKVIFNQGVTNEQIPACMECHGSDGQGAGPFPRLAGQRYGYIVQQLTYFHNGTRVNTLMNQIVKNITVAQMKDVAAYLSSL